MSYCSRSRRRRFTVLDFISWAHIRIRGHFQQYYLFCSYAETVIYELPCKFRHRRSIRRPRFPVRVQHFRDLATFSGNFYILYTECPPYFYFRFVWPTDLRSIPQASIPTSIISTNFEVNITIHCRVIAFFVCWYVTWRFDLEQLTYIACHVTNLATKFEDPTPICSWVLSYNVARWLPL